MAREGRPRGTSTVQIERSRQEDRGIGSTPMLLRSHHPAYFAESNCMSSWSLRGSRERPLISALGLRIVQKYVTACRLQPTSHRRQDKKILCSCVRVERSS